MAIRSEIIDIVAALPWPLLVVFGFIVVALLWMLVFDRDELEAPPWDKEIWTDRKAVAGDEARDKITRPHELTP